MTRAGRRFQQSAKMTMKSGVDLWLASVLSASILVCLWAGIVMILDGSFWGWLMGVATLLLGTGLPAWMLLETVYQLEEEQLVARTGPFRWCVAYRDIRSVTPKRSVMAGPALSMDRVVIDYGPMRWLVISPRDPEAFMQALKARVKPADQVP